MGVIGRVPFTGLAIHASTQERRMITIALLNSSSIPLLGQKSCSLALQDTGECMLS